MVGQVQALLGAKRALSYRLRRQRALPERIKIASLLILLLSGSFDLTMVFLVNYCESYKPALLKDAALWTTATLERWLLSKTLQAALFASLAWRGHPLRGEVDAFLLESLVAEEIYEQNRKGVVMPHRDVLFCYVQFASFLPDSCDVLRRLRYLVEHPKYSTQWGRYFRVRWHLEHNVLQKAKPLEGDDLFTRVGRNKRSSYCSSDMFSTQALTQRCPCMICRCLLRVREIGVYSAQNMFSRMPRSAPTCNG